MRFDKYSGCGNDFIIIDNRNGACESCDVALICNRKEGVGADGVIFIEDSSNGDITMRIFNPDGGEAEMCGNGLRCCVDYCYRKGLCDSQCVIETAAGLLEAEWREGSVICTMPSPSTLRIVEVEGKTFSYLNTGVPHAITFVDEIDTFNLNHWGPIVRHSPLFAPNGTNVSIAAMTGPQSLQLRTYERGVEGETESCGTAATAAAIATGAPSPVEVTTLNGATLTITFSNDRSHCTMSGPATRIYQGEFLLC